MGTSAFWNAFIVVAKDHPHACGDKAWVSYFLLLSLGSSPRVWGQVDKEEYDRLQARIIPTRVGTRVLDGRRECIDWDHPHACGDKFIMRSRLVVSEGSSPRVWGQADICDFDTDVEGIIPTRVGTRGNGFGGLLLTGDHPHACGDKQSLRVRSVMPMGSSPRVWGQALVGSVCPSSVGIIPTRVGTRLGCAIL